MTLRDEPESWPVTNSEMVFEGALLGVRRDTVSHDGATFDREIITHPGAVGIVALDDEGKVLVLRQYRHPSQAVMVEIPAGLLDVAGEPPLEAARRELREEGLLEAEHWTPLLEMRTSAGASTENIHLFLAEGLRATSAPDGFVPQYEEASMTRAWVRLADLVEAVLAGQVANSLTIAGSLAVWQLRYGKPLSQTKNST